MTNLFKDIQTIGSIDFGEWIKGELEPGLSLLIGSLPSSRLLTPEFPGPPFQHLGLIQLGFLEAPRCALSQTVTLSCRQLYALPIVCLLPGEVETKSKRHVFADEM